VRFKQVILTLLLWLAAFLYYCLTSLPPCNPFLISTCGLTTLTDDPSNTQLNPVSGEGGFSTSTCYPYSMHQLNQIEVATIVNYQNNSMYAAWQALSEEDYSRQDIRFGMRYSNRFIRIGAGYEVLYDDIPGYGNEKDDRLDAGLRLKLKNTTLDLSSELDIPFDDDNDLSTGKYSFCLGQKIEPNLSLACGTDLSKADISNLKLGCHYRVSNNFTTLAAWESEPGRFGIGAVFSIQWFNLSYAVQTHPSLDWTHSIGISALFP
jgi:hypothetical protein